MSSKFVKNEEGVSNIVTSIMMLGVLMSIFGMIMSVYMPVLAKGTEINHMDEVSDVFIDLKGTIDRQIISNQVGSTLSTRIKLGNEGGQLLGVGRTDRQKLPIKRMGCLWFRTHRQSAGILDYLLRWT